MLDKRYTYAIVGASNDKAKYGYIVMKDLLDNGYNVVPINLKEKEILGQKVYGTLSAVPSAIDVVVFLVPPAVVVKVLNEVHDLGIKKVWMQPGSESSDGISYCSSHDIECVHNSCIMVIRRLRG